MLGSMIFGMLVSVLLSPACTCQWFSIFAVSIGIPGSDFLAQYNFEEGGS